MKLIMQFDFDKFVQRLKEMNLKHGLRGLAEDTNDEDMWKVKGYQDCLEDVIGAFKECMG